MFRFIPRKPIRLRTPPRQILGIGAELAVWFEDRLYKRGSDEY